MGNFVFFKSLVSHEGSHASEPWSRLFNSNDFSFAPKEDLSLPVTMKSEWAYAAKEPLKVKAGFPIKIHTEKNICPLF